MADKKLKNKMYKYAEFGIIAVLAITFIALKATNYIKWSWWVVLSPIYGYILLAIASTILMLLMLKLKNK